MKKILLLLFILGLSFLLLGCNDKEAVTVNTNSSGNTTGEAILFVSSSCGHCAEVKEFISENDIKSKVDFEEVQAYETEENYNQFNEKAAECGVPENQRGVPLVFDNGKCYIGSIEAKDYFRQKAGL